MADAKISALTDGAPIQAADVFPVERAGVTYKIAASGIYVPGGTDVAVADGGTGASTAILAQANLAAEPRYPARTGVIATPGPRGVAPNTGASAYTSGDVMMYAVYLPVCTVSSITFCTASSGYTTPTNQIFGLYDTSMNRLAQTADDTTTAWGSNTRKTLNLTAPYNVTTAGVYYVAILVVATTMASMASFSGPAGSIGGSPTLSGRSNTGLTALPAVAGTPVGAFGIVWFEVA